MNRIYQGRVTQVEVPDGADEYRQPKWKKLENWEEALWRHHELFQDAVNYYSLCLAALASGLESEEFQIRWVQQAAERATEDSKDKSPEDLEKSAAEARELARMQMAAAVGWRRQVRETWQKARRRAVEFPGPHARIAPLLGLDPATTGFEDCATKLLADCIASRDAQATAVIRMLELAADASNLSVFARDKLPWLCDHHTRRKSDDTAKSGKRQAAQAFAKTFHSAKASEMSDIAQTFSPSLFVQTSRRVSGDEAKSCLRGYFAAAADQEPSLEGLAGAFEREVVERLAPAEDIEVAAKRYQVEFPLAVLFKHWPTQPVVVEAFKRATQRLATGKEVLGVLTDPLRVLRGDADRPALAYFSNIRFCREPESEGRAAWFEFDLAAFVEAIKAPHRYFQDTQARLKEAARLGDELAQIETGQPTTGSVNEDEALEEEQVVRFGFRDDPRIPLLVELVVHRLGYLEEVQDPDVTPQPRRFIQDCLGQRGVTAQSSRREYSIQERTLRGWTEIREGWRKVVGEAGWPALRAEQQACRLWAVVKKAQGEHREDFGSATLFKALIEPHFQPIWQEPAHRLSWHAGDPLRAWRDYTELRVELRDTERPIRFTPAHSVYSPRFFILPKRQKKQEKEQGKKSKAPKRSLNSEHTPEKFARKEHGELVAVSGVEDSVKDQPLHFAILAGIVQEPHSTDSGPSSANAECRLVRMIYSAPRLVRDQVRGVNVDDLHHAPWIQPMMDALDTKNAPETVNFANCRLTLAPKIPPQLTAVEAEVFVADEHHLQFAPDIESLKAVATLHRLRGEEELFRVRTQQKQNRVVRLATSVWDNQFGGRGKGKDFLPMWLSWTEQEERDGPFGRWYQALASFSCLSVDLGQRGAGAYARLEVRSDGKFGTNKQGKPAPSRFIGETEGKRWHAAVAASGLLRLPGEDAKVWRSQTEIDRRRSKPADSGKLFDYREEVWGERGRPALPEETAETEELMRLLEAVEPDAQGKTRFPLLPDNWQKALTFPEQNDKLLIAARRAQSRVARLHRWCWFLSVEDKNREADAYAEMADCEDERLLLPTEREQAKRHDPRVVDVVRVRLEQKQAILPPLLVQLANRILPLRPEAGSQRGRKWAWNPHPEAKAREVGCHLLDIVECEQQVPKLRGQRGLSFRRIEQIEELRKRFQSLNQTMRRKPGSPPPKGRDDSIPDPCPDLLEKLDEIKTQRVNQTAHMILASALGLKLAPPSPDKAALRYARDVHGRYLRERAPVDFIVIEDLKAYRTSQGRGRKENWRLMRWCIGHVRDKLRELCEPFGIPVLETPAAYSSRFCSRSGVAGFRAVEVAAGFTGHGHWAWIAGKKDDNGGPTSDALWLLNLDGSLELSQRELEAHWRMKHAAEPCPKRTALVPLAGGPMFVPVVGGVTGELPPRVVQADINAAINLGLRAIADPRLWTIHPRLRTTGDGRSGKNRGQGTAGGGKKGVCGTVGGEPSAAKLFTREKRKFGPTGAQLQIGRLAKGSALKDTPNPNYFRDFAEVADWDSAEVPDPLEPGRMVRLVSGKALWGAVTGLQFTRCAEINSARLARWRDKLDSIPD